MYGNYALDKIFLYYSIYFYNPYFFIEDLVIFFNAYNWPNFGSLTNLTVPN